MTDAAQVVERWLRLHQAQPALLPGGAAVIAAVSGGLDSAVLLHLLRYHPPSPDLRLHVAHFDHRMRPGSGEDAGWLRGLCLAYAVPYHGAAASTPPRSETAARRLRYSFLRRVAGEVGADRVATAHHSGDQAETVLFRAIRGTGIDGLAGIPARRGRLVRPLLGFTRAELVGYARSARLGWRDDPTNLDTRVARNRIRREVLPLLESIRPGAAASLARLARLASADRGAWRWVLERLAAEAMIEESDGAVVLARSVLLAYHPTVAARLLRTLLCRHGSRPDEAGTRAALEFIRSGGSGRGIELPGGVRVEREFDRIRIAAPPLARRPDEPLHIAAATAGSGRMRIGGRDLDISWSGHGAGTGIGTAELRFPLQLRAWQAGDRIRLGSGTKRLKRLFAEHRVPRSARTSVPVLVDAAGRVVWVAGIATAASAAPKPGEPVLFIALRDAEHD